MEQFIIWCGIGVWLEIASQIILNKRSRSLGLSISLTGIMKKTEIIWSAFAVMLWPVFLIFRTKLFLSSDEEYKLLVNNGIEFAKDLGLLD